MSIETYGRYQLLKRLATGGMAQIYLARRPGPEGDKLLVVKRILPHLTENDDFVKMFLDEARIAARLNHANVVQIFDLGAQDDSFFIAMEYIHGEDLRKLWRHAEGRGMPPPVPLVCRILIEACAGLDYAHKRTDPATGRPLGIVHRDVSPQNILVTFEGGVKVVDFGIAKAADQATITRSGVLKGKYSYMSPEQAAGERVDCRADIFALGVVLYELLTGMRLFKRGTDIQTLAAVSECRVLPPSQVTTRVPPELDAIVLKALAKDPAERYQEAAQLQAALEGWLSANRLPASHAHLAAYMKELYAERLTEEARSGEVQVEDSEGPSPRRTGQRPPPKPGPPVPEEATSAQRPRRRSELDVEAERPPSPRTSGARRMVEPPPGERPSRSGAVPVLPVIEEEAPTLDSRVSRRGTQTDVKLDVEPLPDARQAPRGTPPPYPVHVEEEGPTLAMPEVRSSRIVLPVPPENEAEEDAPTLAMVDVGRAARVVVPVPEESEEEDAPTLSLGFSRTPRTSSAPMAVPAVAAPRRWDLMAGVGLGVVAVVCVLLWAWPKPPPATVHLDTLPPGATVVFNGQTLVEKTPLVLPPVEAGQYPIEVRRNGYEVLRSRLDVPETGDVSPGLLRLVPVPPKPVEAPPSVAPEARPALAKPAAAAQVLLRVETEPAESLVYVDGQPQGPAPAEVSVVAGREVAIRVESAKHHPLVRAVMVGTGPQQVERFVLEPDTRTLAASVRPGMARVRFAVQPWAQVTCSGKHLGETPFDVVEMKLGTHDCRFFNPELKKTLNRRIEVKPIDLNVVNVKLE
ncbi:protein kinase [Pyxidicoccus parkwayensis]|uniref:non-specific serine/threonine protein kinase n=1 Tax=Pyxidicoccus parkwayensis TaxID=2813578 RepID=A0ABX7PAK7_9BACT|nr:serine/threonine-protein kinase [Pyxidicoccus parkwaysis]QSQ27447.1 protein kinase [Pyxidicoccus parkwaysis]